MSMDRPGDSEFRLPALRQLCLRVMEAASQPRPNLRELQNMVAASPLLTRLVLVEINSAANGLRHEIDSLEQAVALLGAKRMARFANGLLNTRFRLDEPRETERKPHLPMANALRKRPRSQR